MTTATSRQIDYIRSLQDDKAYTAGKTYEMLLTDRWLEDEANGRIDEIRNLVDIGSPVDADDAPYAAQVEALPARSEDRKAWRAALGAIRQGMIEDTQAEASRVIDVLKGR